MCCLEHFAARLASYSARESISAKHAVSLDSLSRSVNDVCCTMSSRFALNTNKLRCSLLAIVAVFQAVDVWKGLVLNDRSRDWCP
jgi:hypothetical protein